MSGDKQPAGGVLAPEVASVIESWKPRSITVTDAAALAAVMPTVRAIVAAAGPNTPMAARRMLWALTPMAVWLYRSLGVFDLRTVNHDNVEIWTSQINAKRHPGWRNSVRAELKKIGATANPLGWPRQPKPAGRPHAAEPYTPKQEAGYIDAAALPGLNNPERPLWVVSGSIGGGLNGPELTAAEIGDLQELSDGRLAVQVRGHNPRLVPIRGCCTDLVRRAVALVEQRPSPASRRFILSTDRNAAYRIADTVSLGRGQELSLRRARNTWLTAHLHAETPLLALNEIARPVSAATLNDLLAAAARSLSPEQAAAKGMGA